MVTVGSGGGSGLLPWIGATGDCVPGNGVGDGVIAGNGDGMGAIGLTALLLFGSVNVAGLSLLVESGVC